MCCLVRIWRKLTQKASEQSTGKLEAAFFESVYRITYASGLSLSEDQSITYQIYSLTIKVSIILFVGSELWYLFSNFNSLDAVIDNISVTIIHLIVMYRYKSMMDYKQTYKKLAKAMESPLFDISTAYRKKALKYWQKRNEKYFRLLLILATCTLGLWYIHPLLDDLEYNFVAAVRIPIEYKTYYGYIIAYTIVLLIFHFTSWFVVVNDLMLQTHLIHLLCQYVVLEDCFENILTDCKAGFRGIVGCNSTELQKILSRPMLGQLAASGMLICFAGYQVTAAVTVNIFKFFLSLLYLAYNLFTFYVMCRWCDEIKMQSERIRQAVYFSGWEKGMAIVPGVRVRLIVVIARASRPLVLTAGGVYDLSLASYTALLKTSYSALTVLLRIRQR